MRQTVETEELEASNGQRGAAFSRDTILDVLGNKRRRYVLHVLKYERGGPVELSALTERVAAWENDKSTEALTYQEKKRVGNALRQFHLPKMADEGFVEYDSQRGVVELTDSASARDFYVDVFPERGIPWGLYYVGLSVLSLVCLVGLAAGVYPFAALPEIMWGVFFVTTLFVSSLGHFYDNYYRMRLGARKQPPEIEEP